ncbi:amidohydrolase family protein [Frondihabitans cladoniiphilus]|uniref:Amidohydrolase family protein n=1 Tax=Frondihabitans cladoniiphilus TaxID=715785 RepID=A0ABP8W7Y3_9MICO
MPIIAIEEHWSTPTLRAALTTLPRGSGDDSLVLDEHGDNLERLEDLEDARLRHMDEQGVDVQIVSLAPPATGPLTPADAVAFSRDVNDVAAGAVGRHPTRLRAFATLPMPSPADVAGELERAVGLGAVGAMVYGRTGERMLDDPAYEDLFAAAAALGTPIFIHPQIAPAPVRDASYSGFDPMTNLALSTFGWGWHLEAATAALRLIARGTFDRHPNLQLVLGHWGELLLFWLDRADAVARVAGLDRTVSEYVRSNVFVTSSGMFNPALLRHVLEVTTVDRLMFSTDYPFQRPTAGDVQAFLGAFDADADRDAFTHLTARKVFGITD